jgi:hypothetical protein
MTEIEEAIETVTGVKTVTVQETKTETETEAAKEAEIVTASVPEIKVKIEIKIEMRGQEGQEVVVGGSVENSKPEKNVNMETPANSRIPLS